MPGKAMKASALAWQLPGIACKLLIPANCLLSGEEATDMTYPIYPQGLYDAIKR
jgi:hypothetical protein